MWFIVVGLLIFVLFKVYLGINSIDCIFFVGGDKFFFELFCFYYDKIYISVGINVENEIVIIFFNWKVKRRKRLMRYGVIWVY